MKPVHAHITVAKLAEDMAQSLYEECAKDNLWWAANPDRNAFVKAAAPQLLKEAREVMVDLLTKNDVPDKEKDEIYDALMADRSIPRGGTSIQH